MLWYEKFDHKFQSNVDIKKDTIQGVFFNGGPKETKLELLALESLYEEIIKSQQLISIDDLIGILKDVS